MDHPLSIEAELELGGATVGAVVILRGRAVGEASLERRPFREMQAALVLGSMAAGGLFPRCDSSQRADQYSVFCETEQIPRGISHRDGTLIH